MKVVIAGGTGFIGHHLSFYLAHHGYEIVVLTRRADSNATPHQVQWDGKTLGEWKQELENAEAVINLAGTPIITHWNEASRLNILQSRLESTRAIGAAINVCSNPPKVWINSSAIGYYGNRGDEELTESSDPGPKGQFDVDTAVAWEHAQFSLSTPNTRQVRMRSGLALARDGGVFQKLHNLTKWFIGSELGNGQQYMSWVHIDDLCALFQWCIETNIEGAVNGTAPNPARNSEFMMVLRSVMRRPWAPPVPVFLLKLIEFFGGPQASLLVEGQKVIPKVALDKGFEFKFPRLAEAIVDLIR